eukprot:scaffold109276_cov21-Tisochrysis_lutea.AAC.8
MGLVHAQEMCQKVKVMCKSAPAMCQKVKVMCQSVPAMCQKVMYQNMQAMCQEVKVMCKSVPAMCQKVKVMCQVCWQCARVCWQCAGNMQARHKHIHAYIGWWCHKLSSIHSWPVLIILSCTQQLWYHCRFASKISPGGAACR